MRKLTTEEFIKKAIEIHGDRYDYSLVDYKTSVKKVKIICKKHGVFRQIPNDHLRGSGCPRCNTGKSGIKILGVAVYDDILPTKHEINKKCYSVWRNMIFRCYSKKCKIIHPTYLDCYTCKEWHLFSNFKIWFLCNYIEGYELDKDILIKGNKLYSPDTCCFVPNEINALFTKRQNGRGDLPIGVSYSPKKDKYISYVNNGFGNRTHLGTFSNPEEAFAAYKKAKEEWIKEVANKWRDKLKPNVYEALMNYQVEITD